MGPAKEDPCSLGLLEILTVAHLHHVAILPRKSGSVMIPRTLRALAPLVSSSEPLRTPVS